ncbi:cytidine deaminase [Niameybacter massiliensis]|uniref:Cytidine deaminase n=1 Tax=Holtiella tumoricola TaxID=3018743 RepID=A0AA42DQV3_9FIRM|nr:cytidine deaminase [Holtiella tumoricola]MDA3733694.1 cytidine deaminase [Holtiella tumoricola]
MEKYKELVAKAREAMEYAYVPYSKFKVGAALLTEDDKIYTGCNVENASFGATNCAERTAIFKAVSEGVTHFKAIAIVSSSTDFTYPCGICRQVIGEFMKQGEIILENAEGEIKVYAFNDLLPHHFGQEELNK